MFSCTHTQSSLRQYLQINTSIPKSLRTHIHQKVPQNAREPHLTGELRQYIVPIFLNTACLFQRLLLDAHAGFLSLHLYKKKKKKKGGGGGGGHAIKITNM